MPQLDAKLSIQPAFERTVAALKELQAALDAVKRKAETPGGAGSRSAISATGSGAAQATKEVEKLGTAVGKTTKAVTEAERSGPEPFGRTRTALQSISRQLETARTQLLGFIGLQAAFRGAQQVAELADRYAGMTARLRIATRDQTEYNQALDTTRALSQRYNQPLAATGTLLTRTLSAVRSLGGGLREAGIATEALVASLRITGATGAEANSAILQFSQALGAGALRGEEFNAINEAAPRLMDALAAGLRKPRGELKALAEEGKLTTAVIVQALSGQLPKLREEAAKIPATIGSATQGLSNAMLQLVGSTAEGSKGVQAVVNLLTLLAENLDKVLALVAALAVGLAALKLGVFAQAIVTAGAAAAKAAVGVAAFGAAIRGALFYITGPVGWIVALVAAAAAWLQLGEAKEKATQRTEDVVAAELAEAEQQLILARQGARDASVLALQQERLRETEAAGNVRRLEAELASVRDRRAADARAAARAAEKDGGPIDLDDPKTRADFEKQYESRLKVVKRFEDERAKYVRSKDQEIDRARAAGAAPQALAALEQQKADALAEQDRSRREALEKFDRRDQATKVAQAKAAFEAQIELALDAIAREKQVNQEAYDDKLRDLQSYLARRRDLEEQEAALRLKKLADEIAKEEAALRTNRERLKHAKAGNDREGLETAVAAGTAKVLQLETEIIKITRDENDAKRERLRLESNLTKELALQRQQIEFQLQDASGVDLTRDQIRERVTAANKAALDAFRQAGDKEGEKKVLKLIDFQTNAQELAKFERDVQLVQQSLANREAALQQQAATGAITQADAERQVLDLRRQQIPVLEQILLAMEALAQTPEDRQRIEQIKLQLGLLKDLRTETAKSLKADAVSGLGDAISNVVTRTKTAKEALLDMLGSFARSLVNLLSRRLAEKLVNQFIDAAGSFGGGGGGNFFATLAGFFLHSGGVVGEGGRRSSVPMAAFALAPRYHAGGIAGLRPREVPAILEQGEEVLTADDPRHVRNGGRGGRGSLIDNLNVTVQMDGGSGGADDQALAQGLGRSIRSAVDDRLREEMRPGGLLYGRA